ncbi:MAG: putative sugar O-methyltransferase [Planctomycetes bacterium]|nr:putative sugar O-methyltransferase [Planctomycetota bacterium]
MLWERLKYLAAKARRAWSDGTLREKATRFLASSVRIPVAVICGYLRLPRADRRLNIAAGFADHRGQTGHRQPDPAHLERIIAAYQASQEAQRTAPAVWAVRGEWSAWLDINFRDLVRALQSGDVPRLAALFQNLHRQQFTIGAGSSYDEYVRYRTSLTGRCYVLTTWCRYRDLFRSLAPAGAEVHFPLIGNPAGIDLAGETIPIHTFRYAYHAREMLEWLRDIPDATIVEIGGGIGGQACQTLLGAGPGTDTGTRRAIAKYLVFDLPEVAAICACVLLAAFPDRRIRLFGEGPVSTDSSEDYDLGVFPHFALEHLADGSVDLFHNACSFSEMDGASSRACLEVIERACRRYLSHINHDTRLPRRDADGTPSLNVLGSELVPDPRRFKRVFKKPRVFCLPEDRCHRGFFEYLYERCDGGQCAGIVE